MSDAVVPLLDRAHAPKAVTGTCAYILPDLRRCSVDEVVPSFKRIVKFITEEFWDCRIRGDREWKQQCPPFVWANIPLCLEVWLIPGCAPIVFTRNLGAMRGVTCEAMCVACLVMDFIGCGLCHHAAQRTAFRNKYGLKGSAATDCLLVHFCWPCVVCQEGVEAQVQHMSYRIPFATPKVARQLDPLD